MKWPIVKIGDHCDLMTGGTPSTSVDEYYEGGQIPWIASGDIHRTNVYDTDKCITKSGMDNSPAKYLPKDSVLIALNGQGKTRATVAMLRIENATCNQSVISINPKSKTTLDSYFLFHVLRSMYQQIRNITGDKDRAGLNMRLISGIEIPLPPLDEQKRIATILDQADELRRKRQRAIDRLNQLGQAIFHEMFGTIDEGDAIPFGDVVYFQEGPGVRNWQFRDAGVKLVNVRNIVAGNLDTSNTNRHLEPSEAYGKYKHFLLNEGDFVLASSGVTWGKIAEVLSQDLPLCLNTSMIRIRPRGDELRKSYLRGFIEMGSFRAQIDRIITGSAQPNFGPSHLKQIKIPVPKIDEQDRFAEQISKLKLCINHEVDQSECFDRLFASLQHRVFQGEL